MGPPLLSPRKHVGMRSSLTLFKFIAAANMAAEAPGQEMHYDARVFAELS